MKNALRAFSVTTFTLLVLGLFLSPFLYMVFTSLKTTAQLTIPNAPIWPGKPATYQFAGGNQGVYTLQVNKAGRLVETTVDLNKYVGKEMELFFVPQPDGSTKKMALIQGFQKGSIFIDPENLAAEPMVWNGGYYKTLERDWAFSPAWQNYTEMWNSINYPRVLWNTFYYAIVTAIGTVISNLLVAYGFSRFRFPGRDFLFVVLVSILFLPATVTLIPTFSFWTQVTKIGTQMGLGTFGTGSWWPLILPHFFSTPYNVFLFRQYFMTLPRELDEAAMMDGAGPLRILWSVIIPQSYPVIVAVAVFHIVWAWNDYFNPLVYLSTKTDMQPVSVALTRLNGMFTYRAEMIQAGALLTLIFPLILFFLAQRFFVQGIVITGVEK